MLARPACFLINPPKQCPVSLLRHTSKKQKTSLRVLQYWLTNVRFWGSGFLPFLARLLLHTMVLERDFPKVVRRLIGMGNKKKHLKTQDFPSGTQYSRQCKRRVLFSLGCRCCEKKILEVLITCILLITFLDIFKFENKYEILDFFAGEGRLARGARMVGEGCSNQLYVGMVNKKHEFFLNRRSNLEFYP